jgi:hypothetical protein
MRASLFILASMLTAAPALAQQPAQQPQPEAIEVPRELTDPQMVARLTDMMQVLSKAFLNLPVGEIQAAAEGRKATEHDKGVTLRDVGRKDDPNFERNLERQIAQAKPAMEAAMKAMANALPAMMKGMSAAKVELERATANLPRPDYPKR